MFHGHLDYFQKPSLEVDLTQNRDKWHSKRPQPLIYPILTCMRTRMNRNSLKWHLVEGPVTYDFTLHFRVCDHTTWLWRCLGTAFELFPLDSHNFMVMALGLCVKWHWETLDRASICTKLCIWAILPSWILKTTHLSTINTFIKCISKIG